jgi:hypothetical protein
MNITTSRPHGNINFKLNKIYQAAAARMFYIWGEVSYLKYFNANVNIKFHKALSSQLETILDIEHQQSNSINDETFEDYYNEGRTHKSYLKINNLYSSNCKSFRS